jgi:prophage antirepressor-like protein
MNGIQSFSHDAFGKIRIIDRDGEPWFVAKDICDALGLENSRQAVSRLDDDEKDTVILNDGTPGNPDKAIISESGLYNLVIRSDLQDPASAGHPVAAIIRLVMSPHSATFGAKPSAYFRNIIFTSSAPPACFL